MPIALVTVPWSGYPWSANVSATGIRGGGAGTPVVSGSGFTWGSIVGSKVGGPVSIYVPSNRGIPLMTTHMRRYGVRGLGQDPSAIDPSTGVSYGAEVGGSSIGFPTTGISVGIDTGSTTTLTDPFGLTYPTQTTTVSTSGGGTTPGAAPWYAPLVTSALSTVGQIGKTLISYQNPLLSKQTYVTTPQGLVYATNATTGGVAIPGLTSASLGNLAPILLVGGGLLVLMMAMKR